MRLSEATILVVDDEHALREIFAKWLVGVGCGKVLIAADGLAALAVLETESIDLLITDVRMPVMDGVTLVRRLATLDKTLPSVVFISGFGDVDKKEMYALGVEAFITKPFDRYELVGVLERALADRACLWLTPMRVAPRQTMLLEGRVSESIRLGRGGFSVCSNAPLSLSKVAFKCRFTESGRELSGQGLVRWNSKVDHTVGIELVYLEESCREWVVGEIAVKLPKSFIPHLKGCGAEN